MSGSRHAGSTQASACRGRRVALAVSALIRMKAASGFPARDFTYDWCADHTMVVVWCPQCEVPAQAGESTRFTSCRASATQPSVRGSRLLA